MSADRAAHDDKTPPAAADQVDGRAGQDTGRPAGPGEARGQRRAETRTREEYAEAMRAGTALTLSIVGAAAVHKICERWRKAQEQ